MTDREVKYQQALKLMEQGSCSKAASQLADLVAGASDARIHAAYGVSLQTLGRWSESIQQFEAALALKPAYCEADWRNMLAQSYIRNNQKTGALDQWRIVAAMEPSYPSRDIPIEEAKRMLEKHAQRAKR